MTTTFEETFKSYMIVSGTQRSAAYQDKLMSQFFIRQFGRNRPIEDIGPKDISRALGVLRDRRIQRGGQSIPLSPSTINRHTQFLRRIFNHAEDGLAVPVQRIKWRSFIAIEPEQRIYPLTVLEELKVVESIRADIRPLFQFSILTGVRLQNAINLRWDQIDRQKREISFRGKSRRPGGKTYVVPLTGLVEALIRQQEGLHPEHVFTYVSKGRGPRAALKGQRLPLTKYVVREAWEAVGLGKRWHDVRHTFGTRLYQISRDIHLVQRAMNHTDVKTTMRYVHADNEDIRQAMEQLSSTTFSNMNENSSTRQDGSQSVPDSKIVKLQDFQRGAVGETRTPTLVRTSTSRGSGFGKWIKDQEDKDDPP